MSDRWLISVPSVAALACVLILLYLVAQMNRTRVELQNDGVLQFNFIQQSDHNYDAFSHALNEYRSVASATNESALKTEYIKRFDVLWGSFNMIDDKWLGTLVREPGMRSVLDDSRAFLTTSEPLMNDAVTLAPDDLDGLITTANSLSERIYDLGVQMFQRKSRVRDDIAARMDILARAFWFFGASFVIAGVLAYWLLTRASRRTAALQRETSAVRVQLSTALDGLTSGDKEREAQNRFIAAASHDLRQPLHAMGLYLGALKGHVGTQRGHRILDNVNRSAEVLSQLLSSLLDISKLDAGVVDVTIEEFPLDDMLERLHQTLLPEATDRDLVLGIELSGLWIRTDRLLLDRILRNLLGNALKYTIEGQVTLSAVAFEDQVCITVQDTGIGIPASEQENVFNEYHQLDNPERDRTKGLGLGLSIVQRLTRLLDLELRIESTPGKGTRFDVLVDRATAMAAPHATVPGRPKHKLGYMSGLSVLVIDDEQDVRDGMETLLKQRGCRVMCADSAASACQQLVASEHVPDVIIADYRLRDGQTGDKAIHQVREELNEDVPAMIVTGDTSPARLREGTSSGFKLLHKPVIADELFAEIDNLAGEKR